MAWPPPPGVDSLISPPLKRSSQALYHQTIFNSLGQSEAWYSTNALAKRPRFQSATDLPIYPQRPGEKDCAHYMLTRTCKFGDSCKFDHPVWVPLGGIPDWKEVPVIGTSETLPERPGQPDCPYFLKTQRCKYGFKCKFNHPKDKLAMGASEISDSSALPERPSELLCAFYMKTGKCKFGATCKFHHPKDIGILSTVQEDSKGEQSAMNTGGLTDTTVLKASVSLTPALFHNSKGLPLRQGEVDCPFYMKTGSCKYGATCRYNHPDRNGIHTVLISLVCNFIHILVKKSMCQNFVYDPFFVSIKPPAAAIGHPLIAPTAASFNIGVIDPAASLYQAFDPILAQPMVAVSYAQRPGQTECDFYMKTGVCKFGERCKFHHPLDRSAPANKGVQQQNVKLTLAGLPRREEALHCPYYMKTGTCKYGATCKFDHPPPGEVMAAMAASQGTMSSVGVESKEDEE